MRLDQAFRTLDRAKPTLKSIGLALITLFVATLLEVRAGQAVSPESQSLNELLASVLFLAAAFFGLRGIWGLFRLWAVSQTPSVPTHDFGNSDGFESPKDAARGMRGDKL
jgi:hypothetical protein